MVNTFKKSAAKHIKKSAAKHIKKSAAKHINKKVIVIFLFKQKHSTNII